MYSTSVKLPLIFATSLLAIILHSAVGRLHLNRNLNYDSLDDIMIMPYVLQLRDHNGSFLCAATLIAPQYAITAADCFKSIDHTTIVAVAGATKLTDEGVQRQIAKISKHPTKHINVAVLKLNATMDGFQTIPLTGKSFESLEETAPVRLVGWRHLARRKSVAKALHTVKLRIAPQGECEMAFYAAGTKKLFCLPGLGYDDEFCCADAGGPALFNGTILGVVSKGFKCGDIENIVGATSVYDVLPFIAEAMK